MSYLALDTDLDASQRNYVSKVHHSAESLLGIVNDILDFSKIEAGKMSLDHGVFGPSELLGRLCDLMRPRAEARGLVLESSLDSDLPPWLVGSPLRLRQVLLNLLSNALKFTEQGRVEISAAGAAELPADSIEAGGGSDGDAGEKEGGARGVGGARGAGAGSEAGEREDRDRPRLRVRFAVRDTGIGLAEDQQAELFEPFTQGDASTARRFEGSGLGLAICKRLTELMGGELCYESHVGQGTHFWFELDLDRAEGPPDARSKISDTWPVPIQRSDTTPTPRILVAEDNLINRMVVLEQLAALGLETEAVSDGEQVLDALGRQRFDLVLMDCQMPGLDGYEATRRIRHREAEIGATDRLPIVAITAHAMKGDREKCLEAGMDDYLPKPFTAERLEKMLDRWLRSESAREADRT
ncbi:MAG: response regulator, partial [Holophagales bacterium]|nr:response regulator [Holophagales bacterium]